MTIKVNGSLPANAILHSRFAFMKPVVLIIGIFFCGLSLHAQDITGIWRGYFYQGYGAYRQQYKYEVQINQLNGKRGPGNAKAIKGVTYSYRLTSFYGKANFVGIYNDETKEITLKEDTLVEVKMEGESFSCLMTCYLAYQKTGNTETLQGSFSSVVSKKGTDCGSGSVYLERVQESDFHKEAFLMKKKPGESVTETTTKNPAPATAKTDTALIRPKNNQANTKPYNAAATKPVPLTLKPPSPKKIIAQNSPSKPNVPAPPSVPRPADSTLRTTAEPPVAVQPPPADNQVAKQLPPVPEVIKHRTNPLVKTLVTNSPDILIELYDNGEVDGDTITVYHNNQLIVNRKGLSTKPITVKITATAAEAHHEFIMVANNLGTIPPNTALMVVTTGGKRYELFISSDEQKNAKVIIDYKMSGQVPGR
jgi:predicted CopG family antitoxin